MESSAYDLGRILTEKFELPNLKDKGKKRSLTRYTYDLTDRHKGFGQLLDKKGFYHNLYMSQFKGKGPESNGRQPDLTSWAST